MKKHSFFALICILSAVLFCACDLDIRGEEHADASNQEPGTDGYWCWEVIVTEDGVSTTGYWWKTDAGIELETQMLSEYSGGTKEYSYSKLPNNDKDSCHNLNNNPLDWKANYEKAVPGIYMNGDELLAKGTDGSIFHIPDVNSLQTPGAAGGKECIPNNFHAYDGDRSTYFFWMDYYNDNDGNWQTYSYDDTVFYKVQTEWDDEQLDLAIDTNGDRSAFMMFKDFARVADAGDFEETYLEIAKRVQVCEPIVSPSNMVLQYTKKKTEWLTDLYPADMEAKGYVFRYTGSGNITSMSVDRVFEWGKSVNDPKVSWLPQCQTDDVAYVTVEITDVSETDAKAFIDKVRTEGHYSRIVSDSASDGFIAFEADSWDYYDEDVHGPAPDGLAGYVYPSYKIVYTDGLMMIYFTVAKTGFV